MTPVMLVTPWIHPLITIFSRFISKMEIQGIQGPLSKWTNVVKGWQYRWFVLDKINGCLSYYISREQMIKETKRGCVKLRGAVLEIDDSDETAFALISDNKQFHLQVNSLFILVCSFIWYTLRHKVLKTERDG